MTNEKEEVKNKIIKCCNKHNIDIPNFNNYNDVKECVIKLNTLKETTCSSCGRVKEGGIEVICPCEVEDTGQDEFWKN